VPDQLAIKLQAPLWLLLSDDVGRTGDEGHLVRASTISFHQLGEAGYKIEGRLVLFDDPGQLSNSSKEAAPIQLQILWKVEYQALPNRFLHLGLACCSFIVRERLFPCLKESTRGYGIIGFCHHLSSCLLF